jgi:hypothetical protein
MVKLRWLRGPNDRPQSEPTALRCGRGFEKGDRLIINDIHCRVDRVSPDGQTIVSREFEPLNGGIEGTIGRWHFRFSCGSA